MFFSNPSLSVQEGYKLFLGGVPRIDDVDTEAPENVASGFLRRIHFLLQQDRIAEGEHDRQSDSQGLISLTACYPVLPVLLDDLNSSLLDWGDERVVNPFDEVNDVSTVLVKHSTDFLSPFLTSLCSK